MVLLLAIAAVAMPQAALAETIQITIQNWVFAPADAKAKVGDTIAWVNKDVFAHTATARNGDFDVMLPPNKTTMQVVKKAGDIAYYCRFHPNMTGHLTVEN